MDFLRPPFFAAVESAQTVLLAGMGGGYDIFAGLPLYFGLRGAGKTVHLANLSFSALDVCTGRHIGEALVQVTHKTEGSARYFPELYLSQWFQQQRGENVPIYCFDRRGVRPVTAAYKKLVQHLGGVDAVILVDGGTDSLMRGDESGLGTPQEDMASLCAAEALEGVPTKIICCLGFGVDTFHGVSHAQFLESVAALTMSGDYLGAWSVTPEMPKAKAYKAAAEFVHEKMFNHPSIVNTSILSAIEGRFGNYHANYRTEGSELFINPLMSLYWAFCLEGVAKRNLYLDQIRATETYQELTLAITQYRASIHSQIRPWQHLPM